MNNDLNEHQLESLLRGLAPSAASPTLARRVDEELKLDMSWLSTGSGRRKSHQLPRWLMSTGWAAMGAAAAIAVMSYLPPHQTAQQLAAAPLPAVQASPASTISEWNDVSMRDSDLRYSRTRSAKPHMVVVSRELQTWVDPRYSGQMAMDIPSQNNLMPVSFQ